MFAVELVNVAFFACYVDAHKAGRDEAYSFGIGFLITACLMTGITLLDMVNAFCAKNGCWYVLSACFWWIGGCIYFVIGLTFLFMYTVYWASACSVKYPGESYCPAMLIAPAWIFNLPLFVLIPIYVFSLMNAA